MRVVFDVPDALVTVQGEGTQAVAQLGDAVHQVGIFREQNHGGGEGVRPVPVQDVAQAVLQRRPVHPRLQIGALKQVRVGLDELGNELRARPPKLLFGDGKIVIRQQSARPLVPQFRMPATQAAQGHLHGGRAGRADHFPGQPQEAGEVVGAEQVEEFLGWGHGSGAG